jgi:RNA polymerase sigma factor (sigma-70 family)
MESFEESVKKYEPMIYKIINSLHIYKNKEEFYQLGLIGLWEASLRFDDRKGEFLNYAYTYIKGLFLTEMNRTKRLEDRTLYLKEEFWEGVESPHSDQPYKLEDLFILCEGLTHQQRKWFLYTVVEEMTVKEIAEREDVSISAVKLWRKGARKRLEGREIITSENILF